MTICDCNLINPKYIFISYKDPHDLVPTPSYIKKEKECCFTNTCGLTRTYFYNYNNRFNYNTYNTSLYYLKNKFFVEHRKKMQETFHIIKMLNQHVKDNKYNINSCNSLVYKSQYDINGVIGIHLIFDYKI